MNLTDYQKAQLLYKRLTGDFKYFNNAGNKVSRQAWLKMLDALIGNGFIDAHSAKLTKKGVTYCDENHLCIDLTVLD